MMEASIVRKSSAWSADEIGRYLDKIEIPARLACLGGNGAPLIVSLWFIHNGGAIWCATQDSAKIAALLRQDPRCAFEIAADSRPYRGVRGQGRATISAQQGPAVLDSLIERYLKTQDSPFARWLAARSESEVAIQVVPDWITAWDFSQRMTG